MQNRVFNILIVEDEIVAVQYLKRILKSLQYQTIFVANSAIDAMKIASEQTIDLVFMDININGPTDGITCALSLNQKKNIPIVYTTAYNDSITITEASDTNIFGYLIKPFDSAQVEALLHIALKRIRESNANNLSDTTDDKSSIVLGNAQSFNAQTNTLYVDGIPIKLTKKELSLLSVFCENINNNIPFLTLKSTVWQDKEIADSTIRDTVLRLRKKAPQLNIENVAGYGYILKSQ